MFYIWKMFSWTQLSYGWIPLSGFSFAPEYLCSKQACTSTLPTSDFCQFCRNILKQLALPKEPLMLFWDSVTGDRVVPFHVDLITLIKLLEGYFFLAWYFSTSSTMAETESSPCLWFTRGLQGVMVPLETFQGPLLGFYMTPVDLYRLLNSQTFWFIHKHFLLVWL